jgi:hypothetical protein
VSQTILIFYTKVIVNLFIDEFKMETEHLM